MCQNIEKVQRQNKVKNSQIKAIEPENDEQSQKIITEPEFYFSHFRARI